VEFVGPRNFNVTPKKIDPPISSPYPKRVNRRSNACSDRDDERRLYRAGEGVQAPSRPAHMPWLQAMHATGKSGGLVYAGQVSVSTARSRAWRGRASASPSSAARTATRSACCTVQTVIDQPDVARAQLVGIRGGANDGLNSAIVLPIINHNEAA
jgi:hypothetical protein